MELTPTIANLLWAGSNLPGYLSFRRALQQPETIQARKLQSYLTRHARTAFGTAHNFLSIRSYEEFSRRIPLSDYDSFEAWIARIRSGEKNVLTPEPVTHLVPTSGSTAACKFIPFTPGLQREFNAAIAPWLVDMQTLHPGLLGGPAYWAITPAFHHAPEESAVPIGFDSDTAYLGGTRERLARCIMAVPPDVQRATCLEEFQYQTLLHLLLCRQLRLISVWHPSFLILLMDALPRYWDDLLNEIGTTQSSRAKELARGGPFEAAKPWPELGVISCWGDGHAEFAIPLLQSRFPGIFIQRKGLLATEGVITIPFDQSHVLAVTSHFFEFQDEQNRIYRAHELRKEAVYEVILTTAGGLFRYCLGDLVKVTGFKEKTPCLKFLGRARALSDRFGEKLTEGFVAQVIHALLSQSPPLAFVLLAPDEDESGCHYTLYIEGVLSRKTAADLDNLLRKNPHYDWCRSLGQLQAPRLFRVRSKGYQSFIARESADGKRIGDVKPALLSNRTGWSGYFNGDYLPSFQNEPTVLAR